MSDSILVLNAGSSSIKFSVFRMEEGGGLTDSFKGLFEGIGVRPHMKVRNPAGDTLIDAHYEAAEVADVPAAIAKVGGWLREQLGGRLPVAVGHRVVHGGTFYSAPVAVDDEVLNILDRFVLLAPLHQPNNLKPIRAIRQGYPGLLQVACFDTAFHRDHPEVADRFAIPEALYQEGVRRYGFHGLSYEFIARSLPQAAPEIAAGKVVVAHLGSGASLCAIHNGKSVDSTMGFSALDGLPMGTRPGQLDPAVLLYLMVEKGYDVYGVQKLLYHECGLKGLSGVSNDVRELLASDKPGAKLALDYFVYRIGKEIAALGSAMGGLDGIVFTAGIGENSPEIRARISERMAWLGVKLDEAANKAGGPRISTADSKVSAWVIPTNEERIIAEHTAAVWRKS